VRELRPGLWHWEAPHPDWEPSKPWHDVYGQWLSTGEVSPQVSSYAIDDGNRLLLFDPLAVPSRIEEGAAGREIAIVLTSPWHERDSRSVAERLSAQVFVPPPVRRRFLH